MDQQEQAVWRAQRAQELLAQLALLEELAPRAQVKLAQPGLRAQLLLLVRQVLPGVSAAWVILALRVAPGSWEQLVRQVLAAPLEHKALLAQMELRGRLD